MILLDEVKDKIVRNLNHIFYTLADRCSTNDKVKDFEESGYSIKPILKGLISFYLRFEDCESFRNSVIKDERYFKVKEFEKFI